MLAEIRANIGEDERNYLKDSHNLPWYVLDFYNALDGSKIAKAKRMINSVLRKTKLTICRQFAKLKENYLKGYSI
jgi:hypothetical protein